MAPPGQPPAGKPKSELPDPYAPCPNEKLAASTRNISNLGESEYWTAICPKLSVSVTKHKGIKPVKRPEKFEKDLRQQINDEGVFQLRPHDIQWPQGLITKLARNMAILMQHGWPPTFLLMFDEVWSLIQRMSALMAATTGNACNLDVLCWWVDPNRGDAGFSPHRDRQPDDSPATFRPDGSPMYATCWLPLTDACPENSCLYVVPRWADPGYLTGDDDDGPDPLSVALASKESFQAIRALPAQAGSAVVFTHRVIHWGSRGRKGYPTPRAAVSWGCADDAYEPPYLSRDHLPYPPPALRAALACGQMLVYHERFTLTKRQISLYYKYFMSYAGEFHESYRTKVAAEFVAATKEAVAAAAPPPPVTAGAADDRGKSAAPAKAAEEVEEGKKKKKKGGAVGPGAVLQRAVEAPTKEKAKENKKEPRAKEETIEGEKGGKKKKKKKKLRAEVEAEENGAAATAGDTGAGAAGAADLAAGRAGKKAKKTSAAAPGSGGEVAATQQIGKAGKASPAVPASAKAADKEMKAEGGKAAAAGAAAAATATAARKAAANGGKAPAAGCRALDEEDEEEDEGDGTSSDVYEDDEEGGPGWEGLLDRGGGGGEGGSEDEVMEDALEAMLDAELAGRGEGLQDDFDDFQDDM